MSNGATNIDDLPVGGGIQPFLGQPSVNSGNNIKIELSDKNNNTVKEQPLSMNNNVNNERQPQQHSQYQQPQNQQQQHQQPQNQQQQSLDMNQFISGIQRASAEGALSLPQRDIPTSQNHITQDQQIQANYIPSHLYGGDYINQHISKDEIMRRTSTSTGQFQDDIYNELQIPLLIFILYFIFNLPFVRKYIFTYLPMFFNKDGNLTGGGHLFNGIFFSIICFGVFKGFKYLSL
jgi:hypothetical protein